jgi:hypothetical protein
MQLGMPALPDEERLQQVMECLRVHPLKTPPTKSTYHLVRRNEDFAESEDGIGWVEGIGFSRVRYIL